MGLAALGETNHDWPRSVPRRLPSDCVAHSMTLERWFEMPRKWTFQMPKVRKWVEDRCEGKVLNLFGGVVRLPNAVHNDLNIDLLASGDLNRDAFDLAQWRDLEGQFDTVVFDPPYSAHQAVVSYGLKRAQRVTHARDVVEFVLKSGGRVISLGFNSTGMSDSRGFSKESLALVNCGGSHNDIILLSERRESVV
jgi:hypothetical protein